jgi:16S rRNA (uracil1498-N3)-methyltransferase
MQLPVFYAPPKSINNELVTLSAQESKHAARVLKLKKGSIVVIIDGVGNGYRGGITKISRSKIVEVKIHAQIRNFGEPNHIVTLASGLSTGYKFDSIIEKGTELGIKRFVPLITEKSKIKLDDPKRVQNKLTRYNKVALSAAKQCRRSYIPEISNPIKFADFMKEIDDQSTNLIFHPDKLSTQLSKEIFNNSYKRITLIVGPESGFSDTELELSKDKNILSIHLGKRILRTETAGPTVTALTMNYLDEFR